MKYGWPITPSAEKGTEGRKTGFSQQTRDVLEDYAFHTLDLGLEASAEEDALEHMRTTLINQFSGYITQAITQGDIRLARILIKRLQRLAPDRPLLAEWVSILNT